MSKSNLTATDDYDWHQSRQPVKPEDQLELTEAELSEEIVKVLDTENTNYVKNLVIFSFKEGGFVPVSCLDEF